MVQTGIQFYLSEIEKALWKDESPGREITAASKEVVKNSLAQKRSCSQRAIQRSHQGIIRQRMRPEPFEEQANKLIEATR